MDKFPTRWHKGIDCRTDIAIVFHYSEMNSKMILVVIGVFATSFVWSEAISCYLCSDGIEGPCMDPFKADKVAKCTNAASCTKFTGKNSGKRITCVTLYHSHLTLSIPFTMANHGNLYSVLK